MSENNIEKLYQKVDQLIRLCEQLQASNKLLVSREQQWLQERTRLVEKNEMARTRVEAVIGHLKTLQRTTG